MRQVFKDTLDTFPQNAREAFSRAIEGKLRLYEEHARNSWDEKQGIWKANGQSRAKKLEADFRNTMSSLQLTNLTNNINTISQKIRQTEKTISSQTIELALINSNNTALRKQAGINLSNQLTKEDIKKAIKNKTYESLVNKETERLVELEKIKSNYYSF